ncbi:hypothetical protein BKA70DRAFT_1221874 [Coprinopsis sp. MPI-PUGE-AT-0042]|nr:hypothetical protein BKA70DRAFT_1221874 [Coprinopsis sp. MPI-PUGE-AT-0042]
MKFTIVAFALALASSRVAAQGHDGHDTMRNLARSLIEEYEDFLEGRQSGVTVLPSLSLGATVVGGVASLWAARTFANSKTKCQVNPHVRLPIDYRSEFRAALNLLEDFRKQLFLPMNNGYESECKVRAIGML